MSREKKQGYAGIIYICPKCQDGGGIKKMVAELEEPGDDVVVTTKCCLFHQKIPHMRTGKTFRT